MGREFNQQQFSDTFCKHSKLLSESIGIKLNEAMEWKDIPDEVKNQAYELIQKHNASVSDDGSGMKKGFYIIDVTGKHQVYYTFWRFKEIDPRFVAFIKNPIYMGNLTTDLLSSVEKVLSKPGVKNVRVEIEYDETRKHLIGKTTKTPTFTFGKYRGKTFPEVYLENPSYFAWLDKNADPRYEGSKMSMQIKAFAEMYFQDVAKKNAETSTSQFLGNKGDRVSGEFKIYGMAVKDKQAFSYFDSKRGNLGQYVMYKLIDDKGNKTVANGVEKVLLSNLPERYKIRQNGDEIIFVEDQFSGVEAKELGRVKKGDVVKMSGIISDTYEALGIKFTKLNRLKKI